jgi:hypothetical protein
MEIPEPETVGFTVYSKSGCPNCNKVKALLKEKNLLFKVVDCDEFFKIFKTNILDCIIGDDREINGACPKLGIGFK